MTFLIDYCRVMIEEHARLNPIDQQPYVNAFIALAAIQQALHERGMVVDLKVRQVALHGATSFTNCVALVVDEEVLGLHGSQGWEAAGRVGAKIQSTYGWCGDFAGLGEVEEDWFSGKRLNLDNEDSAAFEAWFPRCQAQLAQMLLDHGTQPTAPRSSTSPRL